MDIKGKRIMEIKDKKKKNMYKKQEYEINIFY